MSTDANGGGAALPEGSSADLVASPPHDYPGNLLAFLENSKLHDCYLRVPRPSPGSETQNIPCHRVILSAGSRYFAQLFTEGSPDESKDAVFDLPPLPKDEKVASHIAASVPAVLRFLYSNQDVEGMRSKLSAPDAEGLFAAAVLLQVPSLIEVSSAYIISEVLNETSAVRLLNTALWVRDTLGSATDGEALSGICAKFSQEVRRGFTALLGRYCQGVEERSQASRDLLEVFCGLPVSSVLEILDADDLEVEREGDVLDIVRHVLTLRAPASSEGAGDPPAPAGAEGGEAADGSKQGESAAVDARGPLSREQASKVLDTCRLAHLSHEQLISASRDPLLLRVGSHDLNDGSPGFMTSVLDALSSRLNQHEPAQDAGKAGRPPRPSTQRRQQAHHHPRTKQHSMNSPQATGEPLYRDIREASPPVLGVAASYEAPMHFRHVSDFDEGGVLYWLGTGGRTQAWRNPASIGHVAPLASSVGYGIQAKCEDIVGRAAVSLRTANEPGSFFGVDLRADRLLIPSGYCLRNRNATSHVLLSWLLQGSTDGAHWVTLDERNHQMCLRESGAMAFFEIAPAFSQTGALDSAFRAFRVLQTGKNSSNSHNLALSCLELYGTAVRGTWP